MDESRGTPPATATMSIAIPELSAPSEVQEDTIMAATMSISKPELSAAPSEAPEDTIMAATMSPAKPEQSAPSEAPEDTIVAATMSLAKPETSAAAEDTIMAATMSTAKPELSAAPSEAPEDTIMVATISTGKPELSAPSEEDTIMAATMFSAKPELSAPSEEDTIMAAPMSTAKPELSALSEGPEDTVMAAMTTTVRVSKIPICATASDLFRFVTSLPGLRPPAASSSVFALDIYTDGSDWKSRGNGRIQFEAPEYASRFLRLFSQGKLFFMGSYLDVRPLSVWQQIVVRPARPEYSIFGSSLTLGVMKSEETMVSLGKIELQKVDFMPERMRFVFWVTFEGKDFKLETHFGDVHRVGWLRGKDSAATGEDGAVCFLIQIQYAPRIYEKISASDGPLDTVKERYYICNECQEHDCTWVRTTDFSSGKAIGNSTCLFWEHPRGFDEALSQHMRKNFSHYEEMDVLILGDEEPALPIKDLVPIVNIPAGCNPSFDAVFQLNSLVHAGKIGVLSIDLEVFRIFESLNASDTAMVLRKLNNLKTTCYDVKKFIDSELCQKEVGVSRSWGKCSTQKESIMKCHRVLVTPTKIHFQGPELEKSNHVVRYVVDKFKKKADDFIRVSFVDEDLGRVMPDTLSLKLGCGFFAELQKTKIYDRFLWVLSHGIEIGARKYEYLAYSASQLRGNSVWMFARSEDLCADDIRKWMGDFKDIRVAAKCAARMGQLFSSSTGICTVPKHYVEVIPDIEVVVNGNHYIFSDGIGKISVSLAKEIAKKCGLNHVPSAFQIRYGGYKGVVAVDPTFFKKLALRPSMEKFDSKDMMLCVARCAESMPCFLNREIISLLSTLGVMDEKFIELQYNQMEQLGGMLLNRDIALNVLDTIGGGDSIEVLRSMLLHGYEPSAEPYLSLMLRSIQNLQLSEIRKKCRIAVPRGRVLIGCLDETGTLNYGEVFLQVTLLKKERLDGCQPYFKIDDTDDTKAIVLGTVVVGRNPCLHPGDIRVLQAINNPALEEWGMVDCLVFPQKGPRPHPNECSGGDLDGDLYFVTWDENLVPPITDPPMNYNGPRPRLLNHDVTLKEVQEFFMNYMMSDSLGAISTAHLVLSDKEPAKARSEVCMHLAELHSMAVDFAKTGAEAVMPRILFPKEYPDFMERFDKPSYKSMGTLGALYRASLNKNESDAMDWSSQFYDSDLEVEGYDSLLDVAMTQKQEYEKRLRALMDYYGARSEDEILTGNLRSCSSFLMKDKKKFGEMKDRIVLTVKSLQKEAHDSFVSVCTETELVPKLASAWYHVTYHPSFKGSFWSFPWIESKELLKIKEKKARLP